MTNPNVQNGGPSVTAKAGSAKVRPLCMAAQREGEKGLLMIAALHCKRAFFPLSVVSKH